MVGKIAGFVYRNEKKGKALREFRNKNDKTGKGISFELIKEFMDSNEGDYK